MVRQPERSVVRLLTRRGRASTTLCHGRPDGADLGPLFVVEVEERLSTALSRRAAREYASPPQSLDDARRLAALLLDAAEAPEGEGPWRRPLAGGHRIVRLVAPSSAID